MLDIIKKKSFLAICLAYIITLGIFKFFNISFYYSEFVFILAMYGNTILIRNSFIIKDKNMRIASGIFSLFLSLSFVIGKKVNFQSKSYFDYFEFIDILYFIILGIFLFFLVINILDFVCKTPLKIKNSQTDITFLLITFTVIVLLQLPYLFVYYPGNLSADSFSSINQALGLTSYDNHHPIAFTLFVNACLKLGLLFGKLDFAVSVFSFAQLIILALVLSYFVYWLKKKGVPKYILVLVTLFFGLNPVICMYSITMWKDIMFAAWILLLILLLYDIVESDGKLLCSAKGLSLLIVNCLLISFGRNNGFYVVIIVLASLLIYYRSHYKLLLPGFLLTIITICIIQGPVYESLGIRKSHFAESVGIPIQQIGYTVSQSGEINDYELEFLNNLLQVQTIKESYRPNSPDLIKFDKSFNNEFLDSHKVEFLKVWFSIFSRNIVKYVKAWLIQTVGYYHMGTTSWVVFDKIDQTGNGTNNLNLENTNFIKNITNVDFKPIIKNVIDNLTSCPIIKNIYNIAFMVWLVFFYCLTMFIKKRYKYIIPVIPLLAIWLTMMIAAPTFCEFRYMYSFHLALPFLIITLFIKNKAKKEFYNE